MGDLEQCVHYKVGKSLATILVYHHTYIYTLNILITCSYVDEYAGVAVSDFGLTIFAVHNAIFKNNVEVPPLDN